MHRLVRSVRPRARKLEHLDPARLGVGHDASVQQQDTADRELLRAAELRHQPPQRRELVGGQHRLGGSPQQVRQRLQPHLPGFGDQLPLHPQRPPAGGAESEQKDRRQAEPGGGHRRLAAGKQKAIEAERQNPEDLPTNVHIDLGLEPRLGWATPYHIGG